MAGAGKCWLVQEGGRWCWNVVAGAGRCLLVPSQKLLVLTSEITLEKRCSIERLAVDTAASCRVRGCWNRLYELVLKRAVKLRGW